MGSEGNGRRYLQKPHQGMGQSIVGTKTWRIRKFYRLNEERVTTAVALMERFVRFC
jgi:hypothetical protein